MPRHIKTEQIKKQDFKDYEYVLHTIQYCEYEEFTTHDSLESLLFDLGNCVLLFTVDVIGIYQRGVLLSVFKTRLLLTTAKDLNNAYLLSL